MWRSAAANVFSGMRRRRRRAEQPVHAEESGLRELLDQLPLVTYHRRESDPPGTGYIGGQVEALTGYPLERWIEDEGFAWKVIHPEDRERVRKESIRSGRGRFSMEYRLLRADGNVAWVRDEKVVTRSRTGGERWAHGFIVDITAQKLAEERLQTSEKRYRRLAEHLPLVTYISGLEPGRSPRYVSPQIDDLLGISARKCVEQPGLWVEILHPDDRERLEVEEVERREARGPFVSEYRLTSRDDRVVWVRDESRVFRDADGNPEYLQGFLVDVTQRHEADVKAHEREALLAEALRIGRMGMFDLDLAEDTLKWSDEVLAAFGIPREDASTSLETLLDERVHPEDRDAVMEAYKNSFDTGEPFSFEHRLLLENGWVKVARTEGEVRTDDTGRPVRAVGIAQDITAQVEAREELARAEERYRSLVERIPLVTYADRVDSSSTSLYMSPQVVDLLGYTPDEWKEADFFKGIVHPDDLERVPDHQDMRVGDTISAEYRVFAKDGRIVWLRDEFVVVQDEGEEIPHMEGFLEDISRRKVAEEQLRESEERFRAMIESAAVGIILLDPHRRIIFTNRVIEELLGYTKDELAGRRLRSIGHPADEAISKRHMAEVKAGSDRAVFEKRYLRKDGAPVWTRISATAVRNEEGLQYVISIVEDITGRKQLEDELRHAQKMEAVGRLAGAVAHDFNNLLLAIRGYSELALTDVDSSPDDAKREIAEIRAASESAASLTAQLLALGRKQMLRPRALDLNGVVSARTRLLTRLLGEQITLETELTTSVAPVLLDEVQLEQLLVNVVVNARDAIAGRGAVTIRTETVTVRRNGRRRSAPSPGRWVLLTVTDTGSGMDEQTAKHAFDPFFTTKGSDGTGLGLSTVHGFVEQSGGLIVLESAPGEGTTVKVFFPAIEAAAASTEAPAPASGATTGSETLLLVEDDHAVRQVLHTALERQGYAVLEAASGEDAVGVAEEHEGEIMVMITDVVMPGIGGVEAARRILAIRPEIELIYMSGHMQDAKVLEEVQKHGVFLQKPFAPSDVVAKVRELLGDSETAGPEPAVSAPRKGALLT